MHEWQPWKNAPRDGRWLIARCNDKVTLHRVSWGVDRSGYVGWCSTDRSFGDGIFSPFGGWIEWPADTACITQPSEENVTDKTKAISALRQLVKDAEKCAEFYEERPGIASDPRVIIDIYRSIGVLSEAVLALVNGEEPPQKQEG